MDYKKKYEDALERARQVHNTNMDENKKSIEYIFPELKESEDEKVRKWLIDWANTVHWSEQFSVTKEQVLAWLENVYTEDDINRAYKCADEVQYRKGYEDAKKELEKQGEQKPAWSEEDEGMCIFTIKILNAFHYRDNANWLKSLKERMKGE